MSFHVVCMAEKPVICRRSIVSTANNGVSFQGSFEMCWQVNSRTVYHQSHFIRKVRMSIDRLGEPDGDLLFMRRPYQVTWFASQESMWVPRTR